MVAKAGLGLIGLGALGVGGIALAKPGWLGMSDPMPECHYLSEDHNYSGTYTEESKFGKKYGRYLVGVSNKGSAQSSENKTNKAWWDWAYRRWSRSDTTDKNGKFKALNQENVNGADALKKVCEEAYKQEKTALKSDGVGDTEFKKIEVWKYCSPGTLVTLINENHGDGTTIGSNETNKKSLVSVENKDNDWFWDIRNKDFWEGEGTWSGSKATENTNKSIFKAEFERKNETESDKSSRKTVKELCGKAYKLDKNSKTTDNTDALKFCKLEADN